MSLRILLADDHEMVREGFKAMIELIPNMMVVAEARTGLEAVKLAHDHRPDVIIMDIIMPEMNGIDATRRIMEELPESRILTLSMQDERRYIVEALHAGAKGYILKNSSSEVLSRAIHCVAAGETYLEPRAVEVVVNEFMQRIPDRMSTDYTKLSSREREVLQMIADGKNTKEIAHTFNVSTKTVDNQRTALMKKLQLFTIAELTKFAIKEGLTSLNT
jgi:DNA-binding NarL/FixJ family response regulator